MKYFMLLAVAACTLLAVSCKNKAQSAGNTAAAAVSYTCPMHPDVKSDKPGSCPQCGMDLEPLAQSYTCPMHPDVKSDKPGECPKCHMDLEPVDSVAPEKMK